MKKFYMKSLLAAMVLLFSTSSLFAERVVPQISDGANEYWYHVVFQRTANALNPTLAVQDMGGGDDAILTAQTLVVGQENQLWKFEAYDGHEGYYIMTSKASGRTVYFADGRFKSGSTVTGVKWIASTNTAGFGTDAWSIQREGGASDQGMNPFGGSAAGSQIGEYSISDGGNALKFVEQPFKVSNASNQYWYRFLFQRNESTLVLQDMGDDEITQSKNINSNNTNAQLWKVEDAGDGYYYMTSKSGNKLYWDTDRYKASSTATAVRVKILFSSNTSYPGSIEIQREGSPQGLNPSGGSSDGKEIGETTMGDGGNCIKLLPQGIMPYVNVSNSATEHWYNIEFTNKGNTWLKDEGDENTLKVERLDIASSDFQWKIVAGDNFGEYFLISKNGRKLYYDSDENRYKSATGATPTAIELIKSDQEKRFRIRRIGTSTNMNGTDGASVGDEVNEYSDNGGNLVFSKPPFKVSDENNSYWYSVSDKRDPAKHWYNGTFNENENTLMNGTLSSLAGKSLERYFKFVKNSTGNGYLIVSAMQPSVPYGLNTSAAILQAGGTVGEPMYMTPSPSNYFEGRYIVKRETNNEMFNSYGGGKVWVYNFDTDAGNQWRFDEVSSDMKALYTNLRADARKLYNFTVAGNYFGKYPQVARKAFFATLTDAETKNTDTMTEAQIIESYIDLTNAIGVYKSTIITDVSTITSTAENPKWFYISSMAINADATYAVAKVMTSNGITNTGQNFKFEVKSGSDAQFWRFEAVSGGVRIINKDASGYEFGDPTSVAAGSGTTYIPAIYTGDGLGISITLAKSGTSPLHAQSSGSAIVTWSASPGGASLWTLQEKNENLTNGMAIDPVVSTIENPVYYYIFSAFEAKKNKVGNATIPYDLRSYALISPTTDGRLKWDTPAGDNALWAIVNVAGVNKLKNKATGKYMNQSYNQNDTGDTFEYTSYGIANDPQYKIKSGGQSFTIPYNTNTIERNSELQAYSQTAWYFVAPTYSGTGDIATAANWSTGTVPAQNVAAVINGNATVSSNTTYNGIQINSDKSLTIAAGKELTIKNAATNNGTLVLQSDATNGTATVTGDIAGNATVEQAINKYRSWYMSLPVSGSVTNTGVAAFFEFTESSDEWTPAGAFTPGKGVLINPNNTTPATNKLSFTGTLNKGNVLLEELSNSDKRFHYLGNPYASYLEWNELKAHGENLGDIIWFRTHDGSGFKFQTYNTVVGSSELTDGTIAPMQGFWVRVNTGDKGKLEFTNSERKHASALDEGANAVLRAPKAQFPLLRLEVSDGTLKDHAVVYFKEENLNGRDRFDAAKMMNGNNVPEIWTLVDNEVTVINAMQAIPYNVEMALGFNTKKADSFTIRASEFKGFAEGDRVLLIDKVSGTSLDITSDAYSFSADAEKTNDRFAIKFVPAVTTGLSSATADAVSVYTRGNELVLSLTDFANTRATVYSISGQQVAMQDIANATTTLASQLNKGVYLVVVENTHETVTKRVVVK